MRHRVSGKKLGRTTEHRKALMRNLATELFRYGRIKTTLPKAKALRPIAEKLITLGKRGTLSDRRRLIGYLKDKKIAHKVVDEIGPKYMQRPGGYTRIYKLGWRKGDAAEMAIIELVESEVRWKTKETETVESSVEEEKVIDEDVEVKESVEEGSKEEVVEEKKEVKEEVVEESEEGEEKEKEGKE